jgi:hypothetical protein
MRVGDVAEGTAKSFEACLDAPIGEQSNPCFILGMTVIKGSAYALTIFFCSYRATRFS